MNPLRKRSWSPYVAGAGIGILETVAMATAKRPLGISSAFEESAAVLGEKMRPGSQVMKDYRSARGGEGSLAWEGGVVGGVVLGSCLSAALSGDRPPREAKQGWGRYAAAAAGGAVMMFGARMAKGCTSGHGISGNMQFAASSWVFTPLMFATGMVVAKTLSRRGK